MRKLIDLVRALLVLPLLAVPSPGFADPYTDTAALDELFVELRASTSETEAAEISHDIWTLWFSPNDPELASRMSFIRTLLGSGDPVSALSELDTIVVDFPDYAEGWNQRATVNFMMNNLDASLDDIDKVLALEPRHFGALSGRVLIYLKQDKHDAALREMLAALAIHPYLGERHLFPELAQDVTRV